MKINTTKCIKRTVQGIAVSLVMVPVVANAQDMEAQFASICGNSAIVLSEKASEACAANAMPTVLKDGSRFSNRGTGAEFNTLWRNFGTVETAEVDAAE